MKTKTIDYIFKSTWYAISRMYNEEASKYGASIATGFALLSIEREGGTPSTTLGPKMGMEASSLTRTLKKMEENGLIYREPNPNDGRGVLVFLTEFGREKRELSRKTVLKFNDLAKSNIDPVKLRHFEEVSEIINDMILEKKIF